MSRNVFIVNATQVVISESHPEGLFSVVSGYPKTFDSFNYNNDAEQALNAAKGEYHDKLGSNYKDNNANRIIKTVTLETAEGRMMLHESIGGFPVEEQQA